MTEQKKPAAAKPDKHTHDDLEKRIAELELRERAFDLWTTALGQLPLALFIDQLRKDANAG